MSSDCSVALEPLFEIDGIEDERHDVGDEECHQENCVQAGRSLSERDHDHDDQRYPDHKVRGSHQCRQAALACHDRKVRKHATDGKKEEPKAVSFRDEQDGRNVQGAEPGSNPYLNPQRQPTVTSPHIIDQQASPFSAECDVFGSESFKITAYAAQASTKLSKGTLVPPPEVPPMSMIDWRAASGRASLGELTERLDRLSGGRSTSALVEL